MNKKDRDESELGKILSDLVINRQSALSMKRRALVHQISSRTDIAIMTSDCLLSQIRQGYVTSYLPTNDSNSERRLSRLAVTLDILGVGENSPEIRLLKEVYGDRFVYPPEKAYLWNPEIFSDGSGI